MKTELRKLCFCIFDWSDITVRKKETNIKCLLLPVGCVGMKRPPAKGNFSTPCILLELLHCTHMLRPTKRPTHPQ